MKPYKFTKKFQKELKPHFEVGTHPVTIAQDLLAKHGPFSEYEVLGLLVGALGSLYNPKREVRK